MLVDDRIIQKKKRRKIGEQERLQRLVDTTRLSKSQQKIMKQKEPSKMGKQG